MEWNNVGLWVVEYRFKEEELKEGLFKGNLELERLFSVNDLESYGRNWNYIVE